QQFSLSCFFFQAEDGIRDFHVTGVQTCALPISNRCAPAPTTTFSVPSPKRSRQCPDRALRFSAVRSNSWTCQSRRRKPPPYETFFLPAGGSGRLRRATQDIRFHRPARHKETVWKPPSGKRRTLRDTVPGSPSTWDCGFASHF